MARTGEAIKALLGLQSKYAVILQNNNQLQIAIDQLKKGDIMVVKPGEKIPVDGVIVL